ncbi:unnamed protein product [Adineta steineri]|uniref:G-protein coupled receptors family 1 profile domain-containing protein n=1 Tax=Adineta steineri TaxID=433720 RepID=A0A814JFG0_9BILA|nr:unnamed protein product [Adineta steineri]
MSSSNQSYPTLVLIQQLLTNYFYPIILVFGILGNIINIIIFLRKSLRQISCNNSSSFVNLIILNVGIIPLIYTNKYNWQITTIYCKIRSYLFNSSQQMSRYFIVMACFDRFALCSSNIRLRRFSHVNIARYYIIPFIIIIWIIFPIHMLIFTISINNSCIYPGISALYNSIYGITLVGFIPPILMLTFSLLTYRNLKIKQYRRQTHLFTTLNNQLSINQNLKQEKKDQQVLRMLIIQVIIYISTTTPSSINLLYSVLTSYSGIIKSNERKSIESFISFLTGILNYTYPTLSCYLFFFISHLYRNQIKFILIYIRRQSCFPSIQNNNNNNTNALERVSVRKMTSKILPAQQPVIIPINIQQ